MCCPSSGGAPSGPGGVRDRPNGILTSGTVPSRGCGALAMTPTVVAPHLISMMRHPTGGLNGTASRFAGGAILEAAIEWGIWPFRAQPRCYARLIACVVVLMLWHPAEGRSGDFKIGFDAAWRGDFDMTLREWRPLAEAGDAEAQVYLGVMYANGLAAGLVFGAAVPRDLAEATRWFRRAAAQNYVGAREYLDEIQAFEEHRRMALQGNKIAQSNLGVMYTRGFAKCSWCAFRVIPQDFMKAAEWYRQAAMQQDASAQFDLATMYQMGQGVPGDMVEAMRWYRRAAEGGSASAQFNLGLILAAGDGVARNSDEAEHWLHLTAKQGNANAWLLLGALKYFGLVLPHPYLPGHTFRTIPRRGPDPAAGQTQ